MFQFVYRAHCESFPKNNSELSNFDIVFCTDCRFYQLILSMSGLIGL